MLKINELDAETAARFFAPLEDLDPDSQRQYHCTSLSDLDFAVLGILRCLSAARTGREFLQHHADHGGRQVRAWWRRLPTSTCRMTKSTSRPRGKTNGR